MKKITILIFVILFFLAFFYRYPTETIREGNVDQVYSPAYGKIMSIKRRDDNTLYIAIFLSPLDIHYQFFPVSGKVKDITYDHTGKFELAYELNKSNENEKCIHVINNKHGDFVVYQIAGFLVRRISYYDTIDKDYNSGEKLGLIHFGSRVDLIIPKADMFKLYVKEGDYVSGSKSMIGEYI
jgi:phosphatidylserine decarboxylase